MNKQIRGKSKNEKTICTGKIPTSKRRHYCRMLLTRHYDQRPFDETVCDALVANADVNKPSKKMQNICDGGDIKHSSDFSYVCDAGHTVDPTELFAMRQNNRNGQPYQCVCVIYDIQFAPMNCVLLGNAT